VYSHPVALAQCGEFLRQQPAIAPEPAYDTAGSVADVVARGNRTRAAIAPAHAADLYGGVVLAHAIQDRPDNMTTFVLLARAE